jgi:hypothetical protein
MPELSILASPLQEVVRSRLLERNGTSALPQPFAVTTSIYAYFYLHGMFSFDATVDRAIYTRYLTYRKVETWLNPNPDFGTAGGENRTTIIRTNRITGESTITTDHSPNPAAWDAASQDYTDRLYGDPVFTPTHLYRVEGKFAGPSFTVEEWLSDVNDYEMTAASAAEALAYPDIDSYPIGSQIRSFFIGNSGRYTTRDPDTGIDVYQPDALDPATGQLWPESRIGELQTIVFEANLGGGELPLSFFDQGGGGGAYYSAYSYFWVETARSKTIMTGPVCIVTKRTINAGINGELPTIVKCVPFARSAVPSDEVASSGDDPEELTIYSNPPCQRGFDSWDEEIYQTRNPYPSQCDLSTNTGEDPDCSLS